QNGGISQYSMPTAGYNSLSRESNIQVSDTQIFGSKIINEARFRYERSTSNITPLSLAPSIQVPSYVTTGGSTQGVNSDISGNYEFQNYLSMGFGKHALKLGV